MNYHIVYNLLFLMTFVNCNSFQGSDNRVKSSDSHSEQLDHSSISSLIPDNLIEDGIFWSSELESYLPRGFSETDDLSWNEIVSTRSAVKLSEGCGRGSNRLVTFDDGTMACVRHRQNNDQIQGDIFSFHLARLIGLTNLPPATLSLLRNPKAVTVNSVDSSNSVGLSHVWDRIKPAIHLAGWSTDKPVVVTQWVGDLEPAYIPLSLRHDKGRSLHPNYNGFEVSNNLTLTSDSLSDLIELVQWSDLILFDYLTGNLDRVVNNMFNRQWNPEMMNAPAHNLVKVKSGSKSGLLLFLDNESGLLHGYRLLRKYEPYHRSLLNATCIFRRSTVNNLRRLAKSGDLVDLLRSHLGSSGYNPKTYNLPFLPDRNGLVLKGRLATVLKQIDKCSKLYSSCDRRPCQRTPNDL